MLLAPAGYRLNRSQGSLVVHGSTVCHATVGTRRTKSNRNDTDTGGTQVRCVRPSGRTPDCPRTTFTAPLDGRLSPASVPFHHAWRRAGTMIPFLSMDKSRVRKQTWLHAPQPVVRLEHPLVEIACAFQQALASKWFLSTLSIQWTISPCSEGRRIQTTRRWRGFCPAALASEGSRVHTNRTLPPHRYGVLWGA